MKPIHLNLSFALVLILLGFFSLYDNIAYGLSGRPFYSTFNGATTDFSNEDKIDSVSNAVLEKVPFGKINFSGQTLDFSNLDLDAHKIIEENKIGIDAVNLHGLNAPSILTIYGSFGNPVVLEDNIPCYTGGRHCNIIANTGSEVRFTVDHFSSFSIMDAGLPSGPIAHWKFENNLNDETGNNDGSCTNCPTYANGQQGQAA
ncbi:hypothetical protein GF323_00800, partial [Candidatus Woesearchaeota archaeon]|nr:hypothetical protein [Candidatus Woesearchaeota archaeon]